MWWVRVRVRVRRRIGLGFQKTESLEAAMTATSVVVAVIAAQSLHSALTVVMFARAALRLVKTAFF